MSSESTLSLRSFVSLVRGTTYKGELVGQPGPVLLGLASIQPDGGFRRGAFKTYGGESPAKITLGPGDIYVSLKDVTQSGDLLGSVARVHCDIVAGRLTQDTVKLQFDGQPISQDYVYWLLRTPAYRAYCRSHATGTTTLGLARDDFLDFPVVEPSEEDLSLVELLEALDDRIALLRETNTTLEAIAQALFKSWFVDFDPVRAKQQGLVPVGMDEATAVSFPATVEDWPAQASRPAVSDLIASGAVLIGDGYRAKNDELGQPGMPFVRAGDLDAGQITPTRDYLAQSAVKAATTKMAKPGDTAFTSKGTIGRFAFVDDASGEAIYSPQVCFWRSLRTDIIEPAYLHYWMKSAAFKIQVDVVRGQAAIMDYVNLADQRRMRLDLPPIGVQKRFAEVARALLERISCNRATAAYLASVRDTLLPRLISGQLRLPEALAGMEEAA